jgi:hypothetical protein
VDNNMKKTIENKTHNMKKIILLLISIAIHSSLCASNKSKNSLTTHKIVGAIGTLWTLNGAWQAWKRNTEQIDYQKQADKAIKNKQNNITFPSPPKKETGLTTLICKPFNWAIDLMHKSQAEPRIEKIKNIQQDIQYKNFKDFALNNSTHKDLSEVTPCKKLDKLVQENNDVEKNPYYSIICHERYKKDIIIEKRRRVQQFKDNYNIKFNLDIIDDETGYYPKSVRSESITELENLKQKKIKKNTFNNPVLYKRQNVASLYMTNQHSKLVKNHIKECECMFSEKKMTFPEILYSSLMFDNKNTGIEKSKTDQLTFEQYLVQTYIMHLLENSNRNKLKTDLYEYKFIIKSNIFDDQKVNFNHNNFYRFLSNKNSSKENVLYILIERILKICINSNDYEDTERKYQLYNNIEKYIKNTSFKNKNNLTSLLTEARNQIYCDDEELSKHINYAKFYAHKHLKNVQEKLNLQEKLHTHQPISRQRSHLINMALLTIKSVETIRKKNILCIKQENEKKIKNCKIENNNDFETLKQSLIKPQNQSHYSPDQLSSIKEYNNLLLSDAKDAQLKSNELSNILNSITIELSQENLYSNLQDLAEKLDLQMWRFNQKYETIKIMWEQREQKHFEDTIQKTKTKYDKLTGAFCVTFITGTFAQCKQELIKAKENDHNDAYVNKLTEWYTKEEYPPTWFKIYLIDEYRQYVSEHLLTTNITSFDIKVLKDDDLIEKLFDYLTHKNKAFIIKRQNILPTKNQ